MEWWHWLAAGLILVALEMAASGGVYVIFFGIAALVIALTAALGITLGAHAAGSAATATKLTGVDGPGFTITLKQGARKVTTLTAGRYTFAISDKSNIHNFHLRGPGVNKTTSVAAVGSSVWTLTLKKGHRAQGASLDRFGLFTSTSGGQLVRVFFDDLKYTARAAP